MEVPAPIRPHRRPRAVLFDAGNTLVYLDLGALAAALARAQIRVSLEALAFGEQTAIELYEQRLQERAVHDWAQHMRAILGGAGIEPTLVAAALPALRAAHDAFNFWRRVPEDLPPALDRLRAAGLRLAVISNSEGRLDELFRRVGLRERIEIVVDSANEGVSKPDPEIFHRALERLQVDAARALYVGDLLRVDVEGARAAGLWAALVDPQDRYRDLDTVWRVSSVAKLVEEVLALPA